MLICAKLRGHMKQLPEQHQMKKEFLFNECDNEFNSRHGDEIIFQNGEKTQFAINSEF